MRHINAMQQICLYIYQNKCFEEISKFIEALFMQSVKVLASTSGWGENILKKYEL